jgi:hypothetical protein
MNELHGYNKSEGMEIDETGDKNEYAFGSSGPCILEEYQVKVEEQKKELSEKAQMLKVL